MAGVIEEIRGWASGLKYWEQLALEKIASGAALTAGDRAELKTEFLRDAGVIPKASRERLSFPIADVKVPEAPRCRLERLFNLSDVNALPLGQEIPFGPQLTLIFGSNGAGKTGYTRPLACAAFARGDRDVLPNAKAKPSGSLPHADIEISDGERKRVVTWTKGQRCPELSGFYVFDGNSLAAHLSAANSLTLAPSGLGLLTKLAEATDEVRAELKQTASEHEAAHRLGPWFEGPSEVTEKVATLSAQTDLAALKQLAVLTEAEVLDLSRLQEEMAEIRSPQRSRYIEGRERDADDLDRFLEAIGRAEALLADKVVDETIALVTALQSSRERAQKLGSDQFRHQALTEVGSDAWLQFVTAAKRLADVEGRRGRAYPELGDFCLLCHQSLSNDAVDVVRRVWSFLESDSQAVLRRAEQGCRQKVSALQKTNLNYFEVDSAARRLLGSELPMVIPAIESQLEAFRARASALITRLESLKDELPPPLVVPDYTDVRSIIKARRQQVASLRSPESVERLKAAGEACRRLHHRQILGQHLEEVTSYVEGRKWAAKVRAGLGTTRHITDEYNALFEKLVTQKYVAMFQETLGRFKSRVEVTILTRGQKGERLRQIILNPTAFRPDYAVQQVLSDGEKTAVAIADFLTEAGLDGSSSGIILDDPITSLADDWKAALAECLAERAKSCQVIVFSHDLTFAYHITENARRLGVDVRSHWVQEENGFPGYVYPNNSPVCERDYRSADRARKFYSDALKAAPEDRQTLLQHGFGALRTSYEALVMFELFNGVILRFEERIQFDKLKDVHFESADVATIVERMGDLSRHIEAHLHSDKFAAIKPTPELLLEEITAFEELRAKLKESRKLKSPRATPTAGQSPAATS